MDEIPDVTNFEETPEDLFSKVLNEVKKIQAGNPSCVLNIDEFFDLELLEKLENKGYIVSIISNYDTKRKPKIQTKVKITNPALESTQTFSTKVNDQMKFMGVDLNLNEDAQNLLNMFFPSCN